MIDDSQKRLLIGYYGLGKGNIIRKMWFNEKYIYYWC